MDSTPEYPTKEGIEVQTTRCSPIRLLLGFGLATLGVVAGQSSAQCPGYLTGAIAAPDAGATFKGFGLTVAIDGDTLVAGARSDSQAGSAAGAAYVFKKLAGQWVFQVKLIGSDTQAGDQFGRAVAIGNGGRRIIVSAPEDDEFGLNWGAAYVFERQPTGWVETAKVKPVPPAPGELTKSFGVAVAVTGDSVFVSSMGLIHAFELEGGAWVHKQTFWPASGVADVTFGLDVETDGGSMFAVARYPIGAVYEYAKVAGQWMLRATIVPSPADSEFGSMLEVEGNTIAVGSWNDSSGGGVFNGSVYMFERIAGTWLQTDKLYSPSCTLICFFGDGVALGGDTLVVSQTNQPEAAIHVYRRVGVGMWKFHAGGPLESFSPGYKLPLYNAHQFPLIDDGKLLMTVVNKTNPGDEQVQVIELNQGYDLFGCKGAVSIGGPSPVQLDISAGPAAGGQLYLVLGSVSGTSPGVALGGGITLPLNSDAYTLFTLQNPNSVVLSSSLGILDVDGNGTCTFLLPSGLSSGLAGKTVHHAVVVLDILSGTAGIQSATSAFGVSLTL